MDLALFSADGFMFVMRWLHFVFGITWIGLLYYFNFVQGSFFAETDASTKSNAIQKLVPRALWWFRWGAMGTFLTGWIIILYRGHLGGHEIYMTSWGIVIMTGALFASLMWANVWFIIWPNQKIVIASATQAATGGAALPTAAAAGAKAALASRTNTLFSIPMLFCMGAASHLPLSVTPESNLGLYWLIILIIAGALEFNAIKGKMGPITTIKGVIHMGFLLSFIVYAVMEVVL